MRFFPFFVIAILNIFPLQAFKMADRLLEAKKGDFVVTAQDKNYSLLLLREKNKEALVFEEVTIPCNKIHLPGMDWIDWMALGAPGHTSWIQYEINPDTLKLIECYSCSKKSWLYMEESEHFFSKLLSLELSLTPSEEKKKIGPSPLAGEADLRPLWSPTLTSFSKKTKVPCESWNTSWPKDDTLLSSCRITLYFPEKEKTCFPIWIEANNGHFNYSIRGIHVGKNLSSPIPHLVPKKAPRIISSSGKTETHKILTIKTPSYHKKFSLFLFDITRLSEKIGPISFTLEPGQDKETFNLLISNKDLSSLLLKNHRYKWLLYTDKSSSPSSESEDFFHWNP